MADRSAATSFYASLISVLAVAGATTLGCSGAQEELSAATASEVTDIDTTPVKTQVIGNCWTYATAGWAESLLKRGGGGEQNVSESYMTYWHWFREITSGEADDAVRLTGKLATGGTWNEGAEIMRLYGLAFGNDFLPGDAEPEKPVEQSRAYARINESLRSGALGAPAARRDRALVRRELNRAWDLRPDVVATLDRVFGPAAENMLARPRPDIAGTFVRSARDLPIGEITNPVLNVTAQATLADAIGDPAAGNVNVRVGRFAFNYVDYPGPQPTRRAKQKRLQRALHAGFPSVVGWLVDNGARKGERYEGAPAAPAVGAGGHVTLIEDYQVTNVPGFGTLPAGSPETRPAALEAALSDEAEIEFVRVKNSWGLGAPTDDLAGYHDLYLSYLDGPVPFCKTAARPCTQTIQTTPLWWFIVPAGF